MSSIKIWVKTRYSCQYIVIKALLSLHSSSAPPHFFNKPRTIKSYWCRIFFYLRWKSLQNSFFEEKFGFLLLCVFFHVWQYTMYWGVRSIELKNFQLTTLNTEHTYIYLSTLWISMYYVLYHFLHRILKVLKNLKCSYDHTF